ncbi:hypothetical protein L226DRAFT_130344 [Lentinus tigrinus ALCF2SS1-7]|uniref:Uncharacterized protein n=1 Tax=Lentinus tigrinus ALCF2SS1-6 TaxID=1328759 RepID=A0A5C2SW36_9APHY|nr:hypothetical protein L227DRAFT_17053 [Lentinus tigrinus ALCF2SS1-6]RPD81130.1 hypothetical protein L226DRAFT_130344 [Lentinus tigrinus ALCF2SS1-7]
MQPPSSIIIPDLIRSLSPFLYSPASIAFPYILRSSADSLPPSYLPQVLVVLQCLLPMHAAHSHPHTHTCLLAFTPHTGHRAHSHFRVSESWPAPVPSPHSLHIPLSTPSRTPLMSPTRRRCRRWPPLVSSQYVYNIVGMPPALFMDALLFFVLDLLLLLVLHY